MPSVVICCLLLTGWYASSFARKWRILDVFCRAVRSIFAFLGNEIFIPGSDGSGWQFLLFSGIVDFCHLFRWIYNWALAVFLCRFCYTRLLRWFCTVCNEHAPYCHLWPALLYNIFPHCLINGAIFEKKVFEPKMCVLIVSTNFA